MICPPRVHACAWAYGDSHDPWPGDVYPSYWGMLRFDGQVWRYAAGRAATWR